MTKADAEDLTSIRIEAVRLHARAFIVTVVVAEIGRRDLHLFAFREFKTFGHECSFLNGMREARASLKSSFTLSGRSRFIPNMAYAMRCIVAIELRYRQFPDVFVDIALILAIGHKRSGQFRCHRGVENAAQVIRLAL